MKRVAADVRGAAPFHLFLVHSHITHIVARGVIDYRGLDPRRVAFLSARGFVPPAAQPAIRTEPFDFELVPSSRKDRPSMWQGWRTLATIDRLLHDVTVGRRYHLYTPQTMEHSAQVLKNSRACSGFSFIEEGLHSYCSRAEMARTHPPRRPKRWERLAYRNRIRPSQFFDPGQAHAYGVADAVFPDLEHRVVLADVFTPCDAAQVAGVDHVLVFDSLAAYRRIAVDSLLRVLQRLLQRLAREQVALLHYKLHPAQVGSAEQTAIERLLRQGGIEVRRLDDGIALEGLALARPQARFYVNLSSVGLYAALLGARAWSFAPWLAELEPAFERYIDLAPKLFGERVEMLR